MPLMESEPMPDDLAAQLLAAAVPGATVHLTTDQFDVTPLLPHNQLQQPGDPRARLTPEQCAMLDEAVAAWLEKRAEATKLAGSIADEETMIRLYLRPGERWVLPNSNQGTQIKRPARAFSLKAALGILTPEQQESCRVHPVDPLKVKALLKLLGRYDDAMLPGTGNGAVAEL